MTNMHHTEERTSWRTSKTHRTVNAPVLIVGLPGIGNVGKLVVDFIIQEVEAEEHTTFSSYSFPHSVFINHDDIVELPSITLHSKQRKGKSDLLLLSGDLQPANEESCYQFCELLDSIAKELGVEKIYTLGGIGKKEEPKVQKVFTASNSMLFKDEFNKRHNILEKTHGAVGPIVGVSGVLPGMTKIPSIIILAETFGHPLFVGMDAAKAILRVLNEELLLELDVEKLSEDFEREEESLEKSKKLSQFPEKTYYIG